ncbi:hypothetical protein KL931_004607 [Ogataea haglerorum]|nr:hypothetical protein KL931_004607 [Ogataea haglerorum]
MAVAVHMVDWLLRQFRDLVSDSGSLTDIAEQCFRDFAGILRNRLSSVCGSLPRFCKTRTTAGQSHAPLARLRNMPSEKRRRNAEKPKVFNFSPVIKSCLIS